MEEIYDAAHCSLNVRVSNVGAMSLYRDVLRFKVLQEEIDYYADDENAFEMRKYFKLEYEKIDADKIAQGGKNKGKKKEDGDTIDVGEVQEDDQEETKEEAKDTETDTATQATEDASEATPVDGAEASKTKKKKNKKKKGGAPPPSSKPQPQQEQYYEGGYNQDAQYNDGYGGYGY
mmetsp:Transcript_28686/g.25390  ORF Transcript_28686/g.25390 Transcript_28686/m.25390 type:complete len:176 (+) Transcript_28686:319-846(+)